MNRSLHFGTALSAIAAAGVLSGCATGQSKSVSNAAVAAAASKIGLATRAQAALASGDYTSAVKFAEQAVEHSPGQAAFRRVLGNAYFGAGRFASAESAYRDSLTLDGGQADVVLKLALAQIAQGKTAAALGRLESARDYLEAADYGLAVALAGHPADAVAVLGQAARLPGADARLRQNLALAHGLTGDWVMARTIAAQDLAPGDLDQRIHQWMAMATPTRPSDQLAALTGITPVADPGQPVRLALNPAPKPVQLAQPAPAPQPAPVIAPQPVPVAAPTAPAVVEAAPEPVKYVEVRAKPAPVVADVPPAPAPQVQAFVEVAPPAAAPRLAAMPELPPAPAPEMPTIAEAMQAPAAAPQAQVEVTPALLEPAPQADAAPAPVPTSFADKPEVADLVAAKPVPAKLRKPARAGGRSNSVVQLGAYGSPERVEVAWNQLASKYSSLNRYMPVSMRFASAKGIVYRLSIKGFASTGEAKQLCGSLQRQGANCFVRRVASDAPVVLASR